MRGEHGRERHLIGGVAGSAPRARGTLPPKAAAHLIDRVSPACAGNTSDSCWGFLACLSQPRVRGEHVFTYDPQGSYGGSAPRARGTRRVGGHEARGHRVSPACAGNTQGSAREPSKGSGQPRVRGEHISTVRSSSSLDGSAPRARGTQIEDEARPSIERVSPACAGNTTRRLISSACSPGQPRVRGEHSDALRRVSRVIGSAPRARGTLQRCRQNQEVGRVSPACAGNTCIP